MYIVCSTQQLLNVEDYVLALFGSRCIEIFLNLSWIDVSTLDVEYFFLVKLLAKSYM